MIIYFYSFIPLLFLPIDSSSIRDRNFRNDLVPLLSSRLDSSKKDANSLKIVSNEPFIIQLQMPNSGESTRKGSKEKDKKRKRPIKKRVSKLKPLRKRHRQRRDLQFPKLDLDRERKSDRPEMLHTGKTPERESENATKNAVSREDVLKALSSFTRKREAKKGKKDVKNYQQDEEKGNEMGKYVSEKTPDGNAERLSPSPLVKMVYPSAPKTDKHLYKYSYKDMMSDRERLEKKIKYIRNMMNLSIADDAVRVRRRSESDRTANKIAKMFLTLSAVNGLHDRLKSKCDDDEDNDEDSNSFWEKERQESPSKKSSSSNEERYKVKKWIEHMKNKRSSSKTCPCMAKEQDEESDDFPLEQKLPKNYYLLQKGGGSEESSEAYEDSWYFHRDKPNKSIHNKRRHHKGREDQENKLRALAGKVSKLDLPLDDLELYRLKAKQILQNAEEILDKIKEEEEKRLSSPNILVNHLKELTSRIQTDPRNSENDLIRKIQKTLGLGPASKFSDGTDGNTFLENVKSFILDPYEKAKALTDESTKKLSTYLLRNLGELQEPHDIKENADDKENLKVYFGQVPQKEEEKPYPASLAKENAEDHQSKGKESLQNWTDTVSSAPEEQFKKRTEEIIKEQEKKLSGYEITRESEESSKELDDRIGNGKEERGVNETVESEETLEEKTPLQQKRDKIISSRDSKENDETKKVDKSETTQYSTSKESDHVSEKEVSEEAGENEESKRLKEKAAEQEVLKELLEGFDENEESVESEAELGYKESSFKEGKKDANSANEENAPVELVHERSKDQEEMPEVVAAAAAPEEKDPSLKDGRNVEITRRNDEIPRYGSDEKTEAKKSVPSKEGKSDEETVSEEQEELETESNPEKNSAGGFNKTPDPSLDTKETVGLNDPALNDGDKLQEKTNQNSQTEKLQREIESQTAMDYPDLLKEVKPDESLEKMNSNEEKDTAVEEKDEKEETLQLETPAERHKQEENDPGKENIYDETLGDDQLLKAVVDNEDQGLRDVTVDGENSYEGFDESKKEVSGNQGEQNDTDESPLVSAISKEISKETSLSQLPGEDDDEALLRKERPAGEAADANEGGTLPKEANGEVEETENSGAEDSISLKLGMNDRSSEKDANVDVDDKTLGVIATSEEKVNESLENSEGSNEAPLKSALNESQEPDKYAEEINRKAADPSQGRNDEDSETQDVDEEVDVKLRLAKPSFDDEDLNTLKGSGNSEVVLEEQKEESFDEGEEIRLEATGQTRELNPDIDGINDTTIKEGNSDDRPGTEREDKHMLSRALDGQDSENLKNETEEIPSEKSGGINIQDEKNINPEAITEGTLKATLEEKKENFDEGDKEESSLHPEESNEKLIIQEHLRNEADDKTKEVEAVSDDQTLENEDINEEISLKATNKEQAIEGGLNINEEDFEAPLQVTLDDKKRETMEQVDDDETILKTANDDDDANRREGDENGDEDTLMKSLNKHDQHSKKADETPLKTTFPDEDLVDKEAEENENKSEGNSDEIPLGVTTNKDDEESLTNTDETPLKGTRNKKDEETLENKDETPLKAVNTDDGFNEKETGNSNKAGEKVPDTDNAMEDDLAVGMDDQTFVRAKNPEETYHESGALDDENPLRATNFEEFNNNVRDGDEAPLGAIPDDLNHTESFKSLNKDDSEESLREVSISSDFNNQIDGENEDEAPLQSVESFDGRQEASEDGYETLRNEKTSSDSDESEDQAVSTEDEFPLVAADQIQLRKSQKNSKEDISSENLQELHPRRNPLKTSTLQVPTSIAKIMKDLEGQGKDDVSKIENLNPEKIDYIIDKIDEVEQQNKVTDEVDCRKECACAENINTRSRNMGRYEIAKDFLLWMKDLQLNRVLSED